MKGWKSMDIKKLKRLFIIILLIIIIIIFFRSRSPKEEIDTQQSQTNVTETQNLGDFNYNNLTQIQKDYLKGIYADNIKFTDERSRNIFSK